MNRDTTARLLRAGLIPLLTHRPPAITFRWLVQVIGHIPFVGLPIVWSIARPARSGLEPRTTT